jgi:tetrahydromethanopterin S-methyltransferase subunit B
MQVRNDGNSVMTTRNDDEGAGMDKHGGVLGVSTGGVLVIAGILIWIFWSFWLGLIIALVGLIAFGGFVRGRWY